MTTFVEIAVNVPQVTGVFHYHLPQELEGSLDVGHLVVVPFGKQTVHGVVLRFIDHPEVARTRPVIDLVDPDAVLTYEQLELARFMTNEYLAPLASCIGLMLPAGLMQQSDIQYSLQGKETNDLTDTQARFWNLLKRRGLLRGAQIDRALRHVNWRASVRSLVRRGLVTTQSVLPPSKVHPKLVRTAQLACPPEAAQEALPDLGRHGTKALARRGAMLRFLAGSAVHSSKVSSWGIRAAGSYSWCNRFWKNRDLLESGAGSTEDGQTSDHTGTGDFAYPPNGAPLREPLPGSGRFDSFWSFPR